MTKADPSEAEYAALTEALTDYQPPCADQPVFTADDPTYEALAFAVRLCANCPIRELCAAYATKANPRAGVWAGHEYPRRKKAA
ncbi:WhiB family transcriptional regulator [Microbacterium sp. NPDC055357]